MNLKKLLFLFTFLPFLTAAQTPADVRLGSFDKLVNQPASKYFQNLEFTSIGPTVMSGRITDIAVNEKDPTQFYVAYASGGLFFSDNNGHSFTPLFDNESTLTIGDIAVDWNSNTIWIGTGENNSSRSSYAGTGIFKSTDKGKTWKNMGLHDSHHIGRIVIHPTNPDVVWIAVIGHLYTSNNDRGIYKTTDGGKTWKQVLFIDNETGAIDITATPGNADVLYAAMWHRSRKAWNFTESGSTSGIYKSKDGGITWKLISTTASGFPTGKGTGRIGLAVSYQNANKIYAVVDNQNRRAADTTKKPKPELTRDSLKLMSKESFLKLNDSLIEKYLRKHDFDEQYNVQRIKKMIEADSIKPIALYDYTADANNDLFDTPVIGAEVYLSENGGETWKRTHNFYLDDVFNTYGYYFGQIRVSPANDSRIITVGVPIILSEDGGKTFKSIDADNMHGDYHAIWINPANEKHMIIGNDGGLNITYDNGKNYVKCNSPAVGQFYTVQVDNAKPYNVYGGLQDNGVWYGPSTYKYSNYWHQTGEYPFKELLGGDGMQVMVDPTDNHTVYTGFQFGWYYRINKLKETRELIKPKHTLGQKPLRFNWQTPIWLSVHNPDILYFGSNKFHRSFDKGKKWQTLSGDLTNGARPGNVAYGTLTSIHESSLLFGLIYTGSDDGLIYVTKDGGNNWKKINKGLPQNLWASRIIASAFDTATVYLSLNGYRNDDFAPYLFASKDFGNTWKKIGTNLPHEPINVIREDSKNKNIIYAGTDNGLYISYDFGSSFQSLKGNLPNVAVHDMVIQTTANDLVIGTHGRSLYKMNLDVIQQLNETVFNKPLHAFEIKNIKWRDNWGKKTWNWGDTIQTKTKLAFHTKESGSVTIEIKAGDNIVVKQISANATAGLNFVEYDLSINEAQITAYKNYILSDKDFKGTDEMFDKKENGKFYLLPGKYHVFIKQKGNSSTTKLEIEKPKKGTE